MDSHQTSSKIKNRQYEIMLNYIESNREMLSRKFNVKFNKYDKESHWLSLTKLLNREDPKNERDPEKWKKGWSDWKNRVKGKAKKYGTRGLTPLEKKLFSLVENFQEDSFSATTSEGMSSSTTSISLQIEQKEQSGALIDINSGNSNSAHSLDDLLHEEWLLGDEKQEFREGVEQDKTKLSFGRNEQSDCKIAEELRKWREQDERKIRVLQNVVDEQQKMQLTLLQMGNTLKKMLDVQEELPKALRDIASRNNSQ